jgi:hypothetical protein
VSNKFLNKAKGWLVMVSALIVLVVVFTQTGAWQNISTRLGLGDPNANYQPPDVAIKNVPKISISPDIANPVKGGENIQRYLNILEKVDEIEQINAQTEQKYDRKQDFGDGWQDIDGNGCDARNDILKRDILSYAPQTITYKDNKECKVGQGTLFDPYTNQVKNFLYGANTSSDVQIDHKVALKDAWLTGAQSWDKEKRVKFANSSDELIAVDGKTNIQKSDGICWDTNTNANIGTCTITKTPLDKAIMIWLPPNKAYWCDYVSDIVDIRRNWGLKQTPQQYGSYKAILTTCKASGLF